MFGDPSGRGVSLVAGLDELLDVSGKGARAAKRDIHIHCLSLDRARSRDKQWGRRRQQAAPIGTGTVPIRSFAAGIRVVVVANTIPRCETCSFFQTSIAFRPALQAQHDHAIANHQDHRRQFVRLAARPSRSGRLMNQPGLRLTRPGQLPAPATGDDSLHILTEAIDSLARLRTPY
jgi:hypothetical protein